MIPSKLSAGLISYYRIPSARLFGIAALHTAFWFGVGFLFYKSLGLSIITSLIGIYAASNAPKNYENKQKQWLLVQFEQALYTIANALQAGKSVENAFRTVESEMKAMYGSETIAFIKELQRINRKVEHGVSLETALDELQSRLEIPEITNWAEMFRTCKRTGGDLVYVMRHSAREIVEKINLDREISVLIAGKRFEAKALSMIPYGMIAMFQFGSPDYMQPLYEGVGRVVMTAALVAFLASNWLAGKIMRLET